MPSKTLTLSDLDTYGKDKEAEQHPDFGTGGEKSVVFNKGNGKPVAAPKVLSLKDLDLFGKPGTKVEKGDVDPTAMSPGEAASKFGRGVVNNLPLIGSVAATAIAPELGIPAMMGMAGAGGAAGYIGRDLYHPTHDSFGGLMKDAAIEGGVDALGEGTGRLIGKGVGAITSRFKPDELIESALMPKTKLPIEKRDRIVQKMLKEGDISPDKEGYAKVLQRVRENRAKVTGLAKAADGTVPDINPTGTTFRRNLRTLRDEFATQADPAADSTVIKEATKRWKARFAGKPAVPPTPLNAAGLPLYNTGQPITLGSPAVPPRTLPPSEALALKRGTYRVNGKKYGQLGTAQDEFEKTIARGLAEDLVDRVPSIGPIEKDSSEFQELAETLKPFVVRERNKRLVGLKAEIAIGSLSEDQVRNFSKIALLGLDNPHVKVALARFIDKASKNVSGKAAGAAAPYVLPTVNKALFGGRDGILAPRSDVDTGK